MEKIESKEDSKKVSIKIRDKIIDKSKLEEIKIINIKKKEIPDRENNRIKEANTDRREKIMKIIKVTQKIMKINLNLHRRRQLKRNKL